MIIRFDIGLSQSFLRWLLPVLLLCLCAPDLGSETVTLTTYYPAPSGVYTQIITTRNTWLARSAGAVMVGDPGVVGANTKMAVMGNMAIGSAATIVNAGGVINRLTVKDGSIGGAFALTPKYVDYGAQGFGDGGAAIYNDNNARKALVLWGNTSGGGTISSGSPANRVEVHNELTVTGDQITTLNYTTEGNSTTNGNSITSGNSLTSGLVVSRSCTAYPVASYGSGIFNCPAGTYITTVGGFMTKWSVVTGGDMDPTGNVLCCPCPAGGCPWL